jgi:hypothetical protein
MWLRQIALLRFERVLQVECDNWRDVDSDENDKHVFVREKQYKIRLNFLHACSVATAAVAPLEA